MAILLAALALIAAVEHRQAQEHDAALVVERQ
jgi:hypothetical protein